MSTIDMTVVVLIRGREGRQEAYNTVQWNAEFLLSLDGNDDLRTFAT